MPFHLVLPGLSWPNAGLTKPAADLPLPGLENLLGHASVTWAQPITTEAWLAGRFGLDSAALPYARLRRLGEEAPAPSGGHWLCVDPVHLHFARDKLLLADASGLDITRAEADTFMAGLNETFADIGRFEAPAPDRWYLHTHTAPKPFFYPIADVVGRPIQLFLPEGEDVAPWARLGNELQVWLYNHPLNAAREAAGLRTVNSAWLWGAEGTGGGTKPSSPAPRILADTPFARGLAREAGIDPATPDICDTQPGDGLALISRLQRPVLHVDVESWRNALKQLDADWFSPLHAALKARHIDCLRISAPGDKHCLELEIKAGGQWKFWRKPVTLATLLASAPRPQPES